MSATEPGGQPPTESIRLIGDDEPVAQEVTTHQEVDINRLGVTVKTSPDPTPKHRGWVTLVVVAVWALTFIGSSIAVIADWATSEEAGEMMAMATPLMALVVGYYFGERTK